MWGRGSIPRGRRRLWLSIARAAARAACRPDFDLRSGSGRGARSATTERASLSVWPRATGTACRRARATVRSHSSAYPVAVRHGCGRRVPGITRLHLSLAAGVPVTDALPPRGRGLEHGLGWLLVRNRCMEGETLSLSDAASS
eukprot:scaffold735_cov376-Prasinococcus_capsulatus_cf.AAC.2